MLTLPQLHNNKNGIIRNINLNNLKAADTKIILQKFYNTAHVFAFLVDLAYKESNLIEWRLNVKEADRENKNFIYFDDGIRTQGYIIKEEKNNTLNIIVIFRGTEYEKLRGSFDDWYSDFLSHFKSFPNVPAAEKDAIKVHQGFWGNLDSVWKEPCIRQIANLLVAEQYKNKTVKVWFAGHSLGAALATLAAARWAQSFGNQTLGGVYTFGSPICGNDAFVKYYDETLGLSDITFRFVNHRDIVSRSMIIMNSLHPINTAMHVGRCLVEHVPIIGSFFQPAPGNIYQHHVGKLYYFDDKGEMGRDVNGKLVDTVSWLPEVKLRTLNLLELALDHDHRAYLEKIADLSENNEELFFNFVGYQDKNGVNANTNMATCNVM